MKSHVLQVASYAKCRAFHGKHARMCRNRFSCIEMEKNTLEIIHRSLQTKYASEHETCKRGAMEKDVTKIAPKKKWIKCDAKKNYNFERFPDDFPFCRRGELVFFSRLSTEWNWRLAYFHSFSVCLGVGVSSNRQGMGNKWANNGCATTHNIE